MARAGISIFSLFFHVSFFVLLIVCIADIREGGDGVIKMKASGKLLRFSQDSALKIALFADLHFGEDAWTDWGPVQDQKSQVVMSYVLDAEKPDFVIFLGDLITANNVATINASRHWDEALASTKARGVPWASILGNHDDMPFEWPSEWFSSAGVPEIDFVTWNASVADGNFYYFRGTTRKDLLDKDAENSFSFTSAGPKSLWPSVSNYALQVLSSDGTERVIAIMYFLDSGGGSYPEVISAAQVAWFQGESQRLNPSGSLPEIVFWHIPSIAYQSIAPFAGIHKPCVGSLTAENVAPQEAEWGIMDALTARKSVKAVFVGHNHGLDWCCPYKSLWLCFARHTGYGGYGSWPRGVRIIEIKENPFSLTSWIRMEDGLVHSKVVLSS